MSDVKVATIVVDRLVMKPPKGKEDTAEKYPMWKIKQEMPKDVFMGLPKIDQESEIRTLEGDWIIERKKM